jgi:glucose uptake protein GlcU
MTENPLTAIGRLFGSGSMVLILGIVAVVLIVVGVIIYRKRSRWDELG